MRPDYLLGHSVGELAAAHVAGVLSLDDACALVAARGRLMGALPEGDAMVAVQASEVEALGSLAGYEERVALAAVNGPVSVVLSGDEDAVLELAGAWAERGRKVKRLVVSHAFHSPRMDGMLEEFADIARGLSFSEPRIPIISNLTGEVVSGEELCSGIWVRHARQTVRFADGVRWLDAQGIKSFLELGPDGALSGMVHECLVDGDVVDGEGQASALIAAEDELEDEHESKKGARAGRGGTLTVLPVLRSGHAEDQSVLAALARVWVGGVHVDWASVFEGSGAGRVVLPTYAFQRERFWLEASRAMLEMRPRLVWCLLSIRCWEGLLFLPMGVVRYSLGGSRCSLILGSLIMWSGVSCCCLVARSWSWRCVLGARLSAGCVQELVQEAPLVLGKQVGCGCR